MDQCEDREHRDLVFLSNRGGKNKNISKCSIMLEHKSSLRQIKVLVQISPDLFHDSLEEIIFHRRLWRTGEFSSTSNMDRG